MNDKQETEKKEETPPLVFTKSVRLSKTKRHQIVVRAMPMLDTSLAEVKRGKFHKDWAEKMYNILHPPEVRKTMDKLPEGSFAQNSQFIVFFDVNMGKADPRSVDGQTVKERVTLYLELDEAKPFLHKYHENRWSGTRITPENYGINPHRLAKEWQDGDIQEVRREWEKKRRKLRLFVNQFNTTKQLWEQWPEGRQYLPEECIKPKPKQPTALMVSPKEVNKLLGLG